MGKDGNIGADARARPLQIPPSYADYAEKHGVFDLMHDIAQDLILNTPDDPLARIVEFLESPKVPKIFVYGPCGCGRGLLASRIAAKSNAVLLNATDVVKAAVDLETDLGQAAAPYVEAGNAVPNKVLAPLVIERLNEADCKRNGYVLYGFPETRAQAVALQIAGVMPTHVLSLEGSTASAAEHTLAQLVCDPETKYVYHTTDAPPPADCSSACVAVTPPAATDVDTSHVKHTQSLQEMRSTYASVVHTIDAREPLDVMFDTAWHALTTRRQTDAPWIPRVAVLGCVGSGAEARSAALAQRYDSVHVDLRTLMQQAVDAKGSNAGVLAKALARGAAGVGSVPDSVLTGLVEDRLSRVDCQTKGWVLSGFPVNASQAQTLADLQLAPNRVFFLDVNDDVATERLCGRRADPLTGSTYHMSDAPAPEDAQFRLTTHPNDTKERVSRSIDAYNAQYTDLTTFYGSAVHVDANDADARVVMQHIESRLVRPKQATVAC